MHILDSLNRGGAEILALDVCRNSRGNNLDLTFVATGGGDLEAEFRNSGVAFHRLARRKPLDLQLSRQLRTIIQDQKIEVVHTHQAVESLHAYLATRRTAVKRVMSFHLCTADIKNRIALNLLVPRMQANVAVSQELLNCLGQDAGFDTAERFHVIHNGVDIRRLQPSGKNVRSELGLDDAVLLLGMNGNFYPDGRKDQLTLCRALPQLLAHVPHAHLLFVGGSLPGAAERMEECIALCHELAVSDQVHFLGSRADVPDILSALNIYVHSAINESLGIAVIEAMLLGLPVVVSDIGALLEVTGNGEYAVTFRKGDADDLASKLIALCQYRNLRLALANNATTWAQREFSIEGHINKLLQLYARI